MLKAVHGVTVLTDGKGNYFLDTPEGVKSAVGTPGSPGPEGVGITNITSDGVNLTFHKSNGTTHVVPWPPQV